MDTKKSAWISCREYYQDSLELGDVVISDVNIWTKPGGISKSNKVVSKFAHGTNVRILEKAVPNDQTVTFYRVSANNIEGWVDEYFLVWNWSKFTFIGELLPAEACRELDLNIHDMGIVFTLMDNRFALVTGGSPEHFEVILHAAFRFVNRMINALAPLKVIALQANFDSWVEVPMDGENKRQEIVGFLNRDTGDSEKIYNSDIETAYSILPKLKLNPYFDLALSDFYQALRYPQHALIFLSRSIEAVEKNFSRIAKGQKGKGKSLLMCELLGVSISEIKYVRKMANASHRRHASSDGKQEPLAADELGQCFKITSNILIAFADYLELIHG